MKEVSNRVFAILLGGLEAEGIEPNRLVAGTGISLESLSDPDDRADWPVLVTLCDRLEELVGGPEALERIGLEQRWSGLYDNVREIASMVSHPRELYWIGSSWFGRGLFGVIEDELEVLPNGRVRETLRIPSEYAGCTALFHIIHGALRATPFLLDLPDADVEARIGSHEATYLIDLPKPRPSLRALLRRVRGAFRPRPVLEQLCAQQAELQRTNLALTRSVEALRESEERHRVLAELGSDFGYCLRLDPGGDVRLEWASGAFGRVTSYAVDEIVPNGWARLVHPDDAARLITEIRQVGEQGALRTEYRIVTKTDEVRWLRDSLRVEAADDTGGLRVFGAARDATDRMRVEAEIEHLASAVNQAGAAVAILDQSGLFVYGNSACSEVFGRSMDALLGASYLDLLEGNDRGEFPGEIRQIVTRGGTYQGRHFTTNPEGTHRILDIAVTPVRDANGETQSYIAVLHDVTREVQLEDALLRAQRMDALGRLAGGLAHNFNNLLTVISGYSEMLLLQPDPEAAQRRAIEQIQHATDRGKQLIGRLLAFSRSQTSKPESLDANHAIESVASMLSGVLGKDISIEAELDLELGPIAADPEYVEHVLLNLSLNARDAMPNGGSLVFRSRNATLSADEAASVGLTPGDYVAIEVQDDGVGMDERTKEHAFEPFFTTKPEGDGSGLGLSTAFGMINQSGGAVSVASQPGVGSTFTIYFPRPDAAGETEAAARAPEAPQPTATILIVNDDGAVRRLARSALVSRGYEVIEATDPETAIEAVERHGGTIDLLLSDLSGQAGQDVDLAARLSRDQQCLRVLRLSDYSGVDRSAASVTEEGSEGELPWEMAGVLAKPFHASELIARVRAALRDPPTTWP